MFLLEFILERKSISDAYEMGYDCGKNGPSEKNCHFVLFSSPEMTNSWELGKKDAEQNFPKR